MESKVEEKKEKLLPPFIVTDEIRKKAKKILKQAAKKCRKAMSFADACDGETTGWDNMNRQCYIIPTVVLNKMIGYDDNYTDPRYTKAFMELGCKRGTRTIKKQTARGGTYFCVWVIPYGAVK